MKNTTGKYREFATTDRNVIRKWVSQGLKSSNAVFYLDKNSYYVLVNMGKVIGTKVEKIIKICFTSGGFIKSAFPVGG